jgi:hypothetical protein
MGCLALLTSGVMSSTALASGKPFVETKPARSVSSSEALLSGIVNPNAFATKYHFEYGTTLSYGKSTAEVSAGEGIKNLEESKAIQSLTASTTYHFRLVAKNGEGTTDGSDQVFTTAASESPCHIKAGSQKYELCVEGTPTSTATTELQKTEEPLVLELREDLEYFPIQCSLSNSPGEFSAGTGSVALSERLKLTKCRVTGVLGEKCVSPEAMEFDPTTGRFGTSSEAIVIQATSGTELLTTTMRTREGSERACPSWAASENHLTGKYECKLKEAEVEKLQHKETCVGEEGLHWHEGAPRLRYEANVTLTGAAKGKTFRIYEG